MSVIHFRKYEFINWKYYPIIGEYWIDPNEGDTRDAILVYCDAKKRATCLLPNPVRSPEINYITDQPETWLSEIENGMKVTIFYCCCVIVYIFDMMNQFIVLYIFNTHNI